MLKIDLSRKRVERVKRVEKYRSIVRWVAIGSLSLFILQVVWLTGNFLWGRIQFDSLKKRADVLQGDLLKRSKEIADYFWAKESLKALDKFDKGRFRYREYLDYIGSLLPDGSVLTNVDFASKSVIVFGARFSKIEDYMKFEDFIVNDGWKGKVEIMGMTQDSVSRAEDGTYSVKIIVKLKNG